MGPSVEAICSVSVSVLLDPEAMIGINRNPIFCVSRILL
ncbi:hypothetical protein ISN45_At02g042420 [Arabidopsis thaliana x Arabidopsis arenosa]|uniref:Uncharacterized protein n=4 Tax=Arabidopsis TaxID=3701 RepID=A0A5S9X7Q2_ARATH|nr:uncharacterized protein AT2G46995 [Arabidopsis thaliana]AEC10784.1 hypothetical protein AT2G46995 [Arabidopsis thaliana]KAG7639995.1 hypothetical protein ISN45_At02g042420 [Arabidopsis thaliana x Arabidopsis arenosa]KAG7644588.1 hypothetical protein ISN44_As02g042550 [Arabidopsis suecica]CAA0377411.1 unnamed protein product [Arabidopsis thaliana]|eukprot:NP_001318438.1 hypothetical protein AT2G46995 [Arabidopsis thaliana]